MRRRRAATSSRRCAAWPLLAWGLLLALAFVRPAAAQAPPGPPPEEGPSAPVRAPAPLAPGRVDPRRAVQIGFGFPAVTATSPDLNATLEGGELASTGALVFVEALLGNFRVGYARHVYRRSLPPGTRFAGAAVERLSTDTDMVWGFHGWRPVHWLFLGYGVALQHRLVRAEGAGTSPASRSETGAAAGLLADVAAALPFGLQLRVFQDVGMDVVEQRGAALLLTFTSGF